MNLNNYNFLFKYMFVSFLLCKHSRFLIFRQYTTPKQVLKRALQPRNVFEIRTNSSTLIPKNPTAARVNNVTFFKNKNQEFFDPLDHSLINPRITLYFYLNMIFVISLYVIVLLILKLPLK